MRFSGLARAALTMTDFDLAIVGAGPAGMSAAIAARAFDLRVVVIDEKPAPGGQIWAAIERNHARGADAEHRLLAALGDDYKSGARLVAEFRSSGARYLPNSTVWHVSDDASNGSVIAFSQAHENGDTAGSRRLRAARIVIASGAQERPVPLPGWTLPGVMSVGAAQLMLKTAGMLPPAPVVIVGCGPLAFLYAAQARSFAGTVSAFVQPAGASNPLAALKHGVSALHGASYLRQGARLLGQRALASTKVYRKATDVRILGEDSVQGLEFTRRSKRVELVARTVLVHDGIVPQAQLTRLLELDHQWYERGSYQAPCVDAHGRSSMANILVAGDARHIDGARAALHSGALAALAVVSDLQPQHAPRVSVQITRHEELMRRETRVRPFLDALYPAGRWTFDGLEDDTVVCRCENITAGAIRASCRAAVDSADRMKSLHRCGMGPCQGRMCEYSVALIAAAELNCHPSAFGLHRIREPIKPISLGALAELDHV